MIGIIIAVGATLGLVGLARHRGQCAGHRRHRRGWSDPLGRLADRLSLSREQERLVREQARAMRSKLRSVRDERGRTRDDLAAVMREDSFDENVMGEMFARHDDVLRELRMELVERLAHVHEALDPAQRARLADLLRRGRPFGLGGPYRSAP